MIFNGIEKEYLTVLRGRKRPSWAPMTRQTVSVPGMNGVHLSDSRQGIRRIEVPVLITAKNFSDLQKLKEDLAEWLVHDEPKELIFKDEPNRVYFALIEGELELNERYRWGEGVITFICPDPFKYGPEKNLYFPTDMVSIPNEGTAEADPIFELTAKEKTTFATISNQDEEYMMIGKLADDDVQEVETRQSVLYENGSTIDEWQATESMEMVSHDINIDSLDGELGTDDAGIRIERNGTPRNRHRGAAIYKELDEPIQDFEIESTFDIISRREIENFRTMIYLLDENMNNIGHIGVKDGTRNHKRRVPLAQLGAHNQGESLLGDSSPYLQPAPDTTLMYLRAKREGNRFTFYIGHWRNQRHETVWEASFNDIDNKYQGRLRHITLFIGTYQDRVTPNRNRINNVELFELSTATEDQTPYILRAGDVVTFDLKNDDVLVNGEARNDLLNFGASFFKLKKGENLLTVTPEDAFDVSMNYREKFR